LAPVEPVCHPGVDVADDHTSDVSEQPVDRELIDASNNVLGDEGMQDDSINDAALPDRVFHYTDAAGLLGILSSGSMFATDFRFLNDRSELTYTYELALAVVRDEFQQWGPVEAAFLAAATQARPHMYDTTPYYLTCFTELENSLSQWRTYSERQGYSVEMPGDICSIALTHDPGGRQNPGITLLRIEYDVEVQKAYIRGLLRRLIDRVCPAPHLQSARSPSEAARSFIGFYWGQIERVSYRFKHPDFAVEREWRLVRWGDVHQEEYRTGALGITPFTRHHPDSWSFNRRAGTRRGRLPLLSVRHGPTAHGTEAAYALDRALGSHGYPDTVCARHGSTTPVRL
jgi:hypothetical protein